MARRQAFFDELMEFGCKLPWRVAVLLAIAAYLVLHFSAIKTSPLATGTTLTDFGTAVRRQLIHQFAAIFQYLLPAGLLIGAVGAFIKQSRGTSLLGNARAHRTAISAMSWRDFERLVGEAIRQRGYKVTGFGGSGPDGGVDLGLMKNGERFLVQCKHWRTEQVGVSVVRELNGVIAAQGAHGGFVVTGGQFTREAREFARNTKVELIDGDALEELIGGFPSSTRAPVSEVKVAKQLVPACPRCGTPMVQRVAKQGKHAGQSFWGCTQYPKCTGILQIS